MTVIDAYNEADSKGHAKEFANAFYQALKSRMSEQDALNFAIQKVSEIPTVNDAAMSKAAYARAFRKALEDGMDEMQARMLALQAVPRRR